MPWPLPEKVMTLTTPALAASGMYCEAFFDPGVIFKAFMALSISPPPANPSRKPGP